MRVEYGQDNGKIVKRNTRVVPEKREHFRYFVKYVIKLHYFLPIDNDWYTRNFDKTATGFSYKQI